MATLSSATGWPGSTNNGRHADSALLEHFLHAIERLLQQRFWIHHVDPVERFCLFTRHPVIGQTEIMVARRTIAVLSDIHYACLPEQARGHAESQAIRNPFLSLAAKAFRFFVWQRQPWTHNNLLHSFLERVGNPDYVVANGDYSCDSAFVGVSDPVACQSVQECLALLRSRFGDRLYVTWGDHELGKMSLFGGCGGPRLASWSCLQETLKLPPFWHFALGHYQCLGVASTLLALPVYAPELLPAERGQWERLRQQHLAQIRACFVNLQAHEKILLFCHDPTALPFLYQEAAVRARLPQVEQTWIGHLHSPLFLWKSQWLAGMPPIRFLGNSIRRMSTALRQADCWRHFNVRLCPALAGIELLKDGGFRRLSIDPDAREPIQVETVRWPQASR